MPFGTVPFVDDLSTLDSQLSTFSSAGCLSEAALGEFIVAAPTPRGTVPSFVQ